MSAQQCEIQVLIRIVQLALAHGQELGREHFVDHVPADAPYQLRLCDDDDVFI